MKHSSLLLSVLFVSLLTIHTGCKKDEGRSDVIGTVTLDGEPLKNGNIDFLPLNPDPDISISGASAKIVDGKYEVNKHFGLLPGKYHIKIYSQRAVDKKTGEDVTDRLFDKENAPPYKLVDFVPPEYNEKSEIYFELQKRGAATFNVDVKTK